jgi:hypothetical protein
MAKAVSRQPFTTEAEVSPCGICSGQSDTGTGFSPESFGFSLSVSFHCGCPYSDITWGMNSRCVGGRTSETLCRPFEMNSSSSVCERLNKFNQAVDSSYLLC